MEYGRILADLSPCGLDCSRCAMHDNGDIARLSKNLLGALTGFEKMAEKIGDRFPAMNSYPAFTAILNFFGKAGCKGCRAGGSQTELPIGREYPFTQNNLHSLIMILRFPLRYPLGKFGQLFSQGFPNKFPPFLYGKIVYNVDNYEYPSYNEIDRAHHAS